MLIDFAMPEGSDVVAPMGGTVVGLSKSSLAGGCALSFWTKAN